MVMLHPAGSGSADLIDGTYIGDCNVDVATVNAVDGVPRDNWGAWSDFAPGSHAVCFGSVAGYTTPACQNALVTAGDHMQITGTYTPGSRANACGKADEILLTIAK